MKIRTLIFLAVTLIFGSCQFNQSVNQDLITGAYSRGDGLGVDDVVIEINGKIDNRNEFVFGENVNLMFNNVSGLTNVDGKSYPELSMRIVKNEKETVFSDSNLLENLSNGIDLSPLQLQASFVSALPHENDEKYKVFVEITDKKGEGTFNYELPFTVKENDLLDVKSNGVEYSAIYLWNETLKQHVVDNNVNGEHLFILILNEIEGLELINDKVFPAFSLDLTDSKGNKILSYPNLLSVYETDGVNPIDLKSQLTAKLTFTKGQINNPYRLTVKLKDKNSEKEVNISTDLNINYKTND